MKKLQDQLKQGDFSEFQGKVLWEESLSKHTYFRIGGPADLLVIPESASDLGIIRNFVQKLEIPFFILGKGSNVLASDDGFRGIVIRTNRISLKSELCSKQIPEVSLSGSQSILRTGASVAVSSLLRQCSHEGWQGLEFLTGVPGSVGGVIRMNAGTHLGEAKDRVLRVDAFDLLGEGNLQYGPSELEFSYRKNHFLPSSAVVTEVLWKIDRGNPEQVRLGIQDLLGRRKRTQPVEYPSCGSVFKNPKEYGLSAWQVIDRLGLRGMKLGNAQFSEKHPNFIINAGGAKAQDVFGLIQLAKQKALQELQIPLQEEVVYLGQF